MPNKEELREKIRADHPHCSVKNLSTMDKKELVIAAGGDLAGAVKAYEARQKRLSETRAKASKAAAEAKDKKKKVTQFAETVLNKKEVMKELPANAVPKERKKKAKQFAETVLNKKELMSSIPENPLAHLNTLRKMKEVNITRKQLSDVNDLLSELKSDLALAKAEPKSEFRTQVVNLLKRKAKEWKHIKSLVKVSDKKTTDAFVDAYKAEILLKKV